MDLTNIIWPTSKTYFVIYTKQVNNIKKAYLLEYYKVAMELWEAFINLLKVVPSLTTRGSIFNANFVGKSEEDISITIKV